MPSVTSTNVSMLQGGRGGDDGGGVGWGGVGGWVIKQAIASKDASQHFSSSENVFFLFLC